MSCCIHYCRRPTTASTGAGLNRRFCRVHEEHFERHGSYLKRSYRRSELKPHLQAAMNWLNANRGAHALELSVSAVLGQYAAAGASIPFHRLRGLAPAERSRAAWTRLRNAGVEPVRVIATRLAIEAAHRADPQPESRSEYRCVQVAKAVHRLASGTHRMWEKERPGQGAEVIEVHMYPSSRGRILRHLGAAVQRATDSALDAFLSR